MRFSSYPTHGHWCGSRVFPAKCWYCGQEIFIFTCNCGSRVLFDDLGSPWPKHFCSVYYKTQPSPVNEGVSYEPSPQHDSVLEEIDPEFQEHVNRKKDYSAPIVKVSPEGNDNQHISGIIREVNLRIDPFKKLKITKGSLGAFQLEKILPNEISQITMHAGGIGDDQIESYTFWVCRKLFDKKEMTKGRVIYLHLKSIQSLGLDAFWLAEEIQFLDH